MSKLWIEQNGSTKFKTLVDTTSTRYFSHYNNIFELYGAIISVNSNVYLMYNMNNFSLYMMLSYFILYGLFYKYIVLKTLDKKQDNGKKSGKLNIMTTNLNMKNRTLYDVITQNDYNIYNKNKNLFYYIIDNIV